MVTKKQEQQWQAEEDAMTMMRYQEITNDKARAGRAIKVAKAKAMELSKRATAMQNVASSKLGGKGNTRKK